MTKARDLADRTAADLTAVTAGTGISVTNGTGPIPTVTNTVATGFDAKGDLIVGTGADTFAKLTVASTAGYLLSVDSGETTGLKWSAPSASGLTLIATSTLSTVGTGGQVLNNCFTSAYTNYKMLFQMEDASTTVYVNFQLTSASTAVTTGYKSQYFTAENTSANYAVDVSGTDEFFATFAYNAPYRGSIATVEIQSPQESRETWYTTTFSAINTAGTPVVGLTGGALDNNNSYDGILIKPSTGTITGKVYVYGYAK
jgi:hypothetical protein